MNKILIDDGVYFWRGWVLNDDNSNLSAHREMLLMSASRFQNVSCNFLYVAFTCSHLFCLNDDPNYAEGVKHYELDGGPSLPDDAGRHWSLDFQCRLEFGNAFGICAAVSVSRRPFSIFSACAHGERVCTRCPKS
jgi:hypothetical protein